MTHHELAAAGYDVSAAAHARLTQFVHALLAENQALNLTAARDVAGVWRAHVCDSLALVAWIGEHRVARLLDLGSGGGLPGIPLACACAGLDVTLLDATRKKVAALERIIQSVGLEHAQAVWGRAETLAHDPAHRERFDAVAARAVATLPVLIEYAAGFVRTGGHAWFFKSQSAADTEVAQAEPAAQACKLAYADTLRYRLPGEPAERVILGYRKTSALGVELPRRAGRAQKRPL
jgi:16S rRNA (guanine527-N7)-methyltransferase